MCLRDSWTQFLFTLPSAVAVINALLAGATVALAVVLAAGAPLAVTVPAGMAAGTAVLALHLVYQMRRFATMKAGVEAVFPSSRPRPEPVPGPTAGRPVAYPWAARARSIRACVEPR
jgi:hypothetical protein